MIWKKTTDLIGKTMNEQYYLRQMVGSSGIIYQ
jgi:hypothetical protein